MRKIDKIEAKIIRKATKIAKKYGIDPQTIDFKAIIDPKLTESENLSAILHHLLMLIPNEEKREEFRNKYLTDIVSEEKKAEELEAKQRQEQAERTKKEQLEILHKIMRETDYYSFCKEYYGWQFDIVMNSKYHHLLIVNGVGGIGKTSFVMEYISEKYSDYAVIEIRGDITAPALFKKLIELSGYSKAILLWDNATHSAFADHRIRNILEQATDKTVDGQRNIYYTNERTLKTSDDKVTLKPTHKIIITTNYWDENRHTQPIKDRAVIITMDGEIASKYAWELVRKKLSKEQFEFVAGILTQIYEVSNYEDVSLTFRDANEIIEAVRMLWKERDREYKLKLMLINKNELLLTAYYIYRKISKPYSKKAIKEWIETTGKSRTYYINMIKTLKELGLITGSSDIDTKTGEVKKHILENIQKNVVRRWSEGGQKVV